MRTVPLTRGYKAVVDNEDYDVVSPYRWYPVLDDNGRVYAVTRVNGTVTLMHRLILNAPKGTDVDHVDRDGLNNRRYNIRLATKEQNAHNTAPRLGGSSPFKGVSLSANGNRWRACIWLNGRQTHLGYFDSEEKAAEAYNVAAKENFGEFARLNEIPFMPMVEL
jgi:hypothetical protein